MFRLPVLIPFVLSVAALVGFYFWYRRKIKGLAVDGEDRPIGTGRLTAERLRLLATPPWRVVFEIGERHLGSVDHVVIGPNGVLAFETHATDRVIGASALSEAQLVANAAIARGGVDELAATAGSNCKTLVRVYWGTPQPELPAGIEVAPGLIAVEGQRLNDWIVALPPGPLQAEQVDAVWQAITVGVSRPDPLA